MALKDLVLEAFNALDSLLTPSAYNYRIPTRSASREDTLASRSATRQYVGAARQFAEEVLH